MRDSRIYLKKNHASPFNKKNPSNDTNFSQIHLARQYPKLARQHLFIQNKGVGTPLMRVTPGSRKFRKEIG
jgi:hypothetical protein